MGTTNFHFAYNARHLKPEDVAKTFIYNADFEELIQDNHTVLLGARGCGKTTLMKMLTIPALEAWHSVEAPNIKSKIGFYPIYISTDIYWNAQKDSYNKQLNKFPKYADAVSKVAVTTNVLYALCEAFEDIIKYRIDNQTEEREIELAGELIKSWALPPTIPTIKMVKEALTTRTDILNKHIQITLFNSKTNDEIKLEQEFFFLHYDSAALLAITKFERIYELNEDSKWAFCFDELELAPQWLQENLFGSLRSRNQKVLYKLSASPIVSISNIEILATPGNDLKLIKMWPHAPGSKYSKFSRTLIESILRKRFEKQLTLDQVFGSNPLFKKEPLRNYEIGGKAWKEIKKLAADDEKLTELLLKHNIDPQNPVVTDATKRKLDTVLRKIKPIVYFRNYYSMINPTTGKRKARSRKSYTLFYGKEVIFKICDGNPRWLIGIVNEILSKAQDETFTKPVSPATQAAVLQSVAQQFFNVIKSIPGAYVETGGKLTTLAEILKRIGTYFFQEIVVNDFQRDPHSTFFIDEKISRDQVKALEKGVYQGAFVLVDPSENAFDFEMRDKRFRLSYLFCPMFKIPLRKYGKIALSKCINESTTSKEKKNQQPKLPFNY